MTDPKTMQQAVVEEIGRLRLSEIEAGLIVTAQAAEIADLKAKLADAAADAKTGKEA